MAATHMLLSAHSATSTSHSATGSVTLGVSDSTASHISVHNYTQVCVMARYGASTHYHGACTYHVTHGCVTLNAHISGHSTLKCAVWAIMAH